MVSAARISEPVEGREIRVRGLVQGVGFRPTVWRLATDMGVEGDVLNDGAGVLIRAWAGRGLLDRFIDALRDQAPPLSRVEDIEWMPLAETLGHDGFQIAASVGDMAETGVVPDAGTCDACRDETLDPTNRRYRYPFTNCTHCGPRLSIVSAIPYDRPNTSMAPFKMCPDCRREYEDPADRRFHAQPNACPTCGPRVWLEGLEHCEIDISGDLDVIAATARLIRDGKIVAIKGIGGFHLACDATNEIAVTELRRRKQRYAKPFALMARDAEMVAEYVRLNAAERSALESAEAPIVVLDHCSNGTVVADAVAPGQSALGFMLPYSPLHIVLMSDLDRPMVLTSGNRSDEPQVIGNDEARERLAGIADAWLMHDREIVNRLDDSVVRFSGGEIRAIRRARGYAPVPLSLPAGFEQAPSILAMGAELKGTFCLLDSGRAVVSQHMGDQENADAHADFRRNVALYRSIHQIVPEQIVVDCHPDYLTTQYGERVAAAEGSALVHVQHHHAHIAAVLAEHGRALENGPVLGVVLDGLGLGDDGALWGGEFLVANYSQFRRVGAFDAVPLIGGAKAMTQPWRNTFAHLDRALGWDLVVEEFADLEIINRLQAKPLGNCRQMLARGINVPPASSAGRLFDAAAAALELCFDEISYEGQAAIMLENLADQAIQDAEPYPIELAETLRWQGLWHGFLEDLASGTKPFEIAARFHATVIHAVHGLTTEIAAREGLECVALGGGVFQNKRLLAGVSNTLSSDGFEVLAPVGYPANDGGISLGQAVVAAARYIEDMAS